MTTRRWLVVALAIVAVLLIAGRTLSGVYSDFLWYDALGAATLWRTRLTASLALQVGSGVAACVFAFANLYAVRQSVVSLVFPRRLGNLEIGEEVPSRYLVGAAAALSIVLGAVLTIPGSEWMTAVLARNAQSFHLEESYLSRDLGFFVYWLPFENVLWTWAFFTVGVVTVAVVLLYALTPSLKWQGRGFYASTYVRRHLTVLVGVLLLMLAWGYRLDMFSLVMDGSGADHGFSWVDHKVGIPVDLILSVATFGAAAIVIWAGFAGQIRLAGTSVFTVVVFSLVGRELAPAIAVRSKSEAKRVDDEKSYLRSRAAYTRVAFGADSASIPIADSSIAYPTIDAALPWVPTWDPAALTRATDAGRSGDDQDFRIAWRWSATGLAADVVAAPPEGAAARAPWTVARVAASGADDRGNPIRLADQRASATDDIPLDPPLVYPGASAFTVISDSLNHSAGTSLESPLSRVANAWALQALRILSSDLPQPRPTLVAHRDIRDRLDLFMPFFAQGRRIEPLLVGDSLYWGVDLYSVSDTYPLSHRATLAGATRSYFRHAAVAIVQASTGDVTVVPDSALDPIAAFWVHRLPSIFGTWSALPSGIRGLVAPPVDGLYAQAIAFGRFSNDAANDAPKNVPALDGADTSLTTTDLPLLLPGSQTPALAVPLLDDLDRVRGLLIAFGGTSHTTVWYPLATPGPRWTAITDRLRSVDSVGGSTRDGPLAHGRIRVVPVRSGIAFAQPTYHWRPPALPTLNRVAIVVGDTTRSIVPSALDASRRADPSAADAGASSSVAAAYAAMRDAMKRGDWAAFGRAFDALGRAVGRGQKP